MGVGFYTGPQDNVSEKTQFGGKEVRFGLVAVDASLSEGIQNQVAVLRVFFNGL